MSRAQDTGTLNLTAPGARRCLSRRPKGPAPARAGGGAQPPVRRGRASAGAVWGAGARRARDARRHHPTRGGGGRPPPPQKNLHVGLHTNYLAVSILLFCLGLMGVILRRNLLVIYMSLELMLNAANLALVSFSRFNDSCWTARCWCFSSSPWRRRRYRWDWRSLWPFTASGGPHMSRT